MTQNKATHTPGRWDYASDSGHSTPCLHGVQHSKKAVVYAPDSMTTIASHVTSWDDARLIAASPELYAALKALLRQSGDKEHTDEYRDAVAALAKATGGAAVT